MPALDRLTGAMALASAATGFALALPVGAALGGAGGVVSAVVPLALLAGAACVLAVPRRAGGGGEDAPSLRPRAGAYPAAAEAPALTPEAWLGRIGAMAAEPRSRTDAIDRALREQVGIGAGDRPAELLLRGLRACASADPAEGKAFLRDLAGAMRLDPAERARALAALSRRAASPAMGKRGGSSALPETPTDEDAHAFVETRLLAAFEAARDRCGIASGSFSWLRFHARPAWFALNSLGRPSPYVEGALPLLHYGRERSEGRRLDTVATDGARDALIALCDRLAAGLPA